MPSSIYSILGPRDRSEDRHAMSQSCGQSATQWTGEHQKTGQTANIMSMLYMGQIQFDRMSYPDMHFRMWHAASTDRKVKF